jgi:hypothetical protein
VLKVEEVLDGYDPTRYHCEKIFVSSVGQDPSATPVQVPVSIIYRKDRFKKDGTNPALLVHILLLSWFSSFSSPSKSFFFLITMYSSLSGS